MTRPRTEPRSAKEIRAAHAELFANIEAKLAAMPQPVPVTSTSSLSPERGGTNGKDGEPAAAGGKEQAPSEAIAEIRKVMAQREAEAREREAVLMRQIEELQKLNELACAPGADASTPKVTVKLGEVKLSGARRFGSGTDDASADDVDADDATSVSSSSAPGAHVLKNVSWFSSSELEAYKCDMTRKQIVEKLQLLHDELCDRSDVIEEYLGLSSEEWRSAVEERVEMAAADRFVRRACRAIIKMGGTHAKVFTSQESELRRINKEEARLGRGLLERMLKFGTFETPAEVRAHAEKLRTDAYLNVQQGKVEALAAMYQLSEDYYMLPDKERMAIDLNALILDKVPREIKETEDRTYAERLRDEMAEYEALHDGAEKYTTDQLMKAVAVRMESAKKSRASLNVNAAATAAAAKAAADAAQARKKGGRKPGEGGRKPGAGQPCWNCGVLAPGCGGFEVCQEVGKECGEKGCPCVRGEPCVVLMAEMPAREKVTVPTVDGSRPVNEAQYKHLAKLNAAARAKVRVVSSQDSREEAGSEPHRIMVCCARALQVGCSGGSRLRASARAFMPQSDPCVAMQRPECATALPPRALAPPAFVGAEQAAQSFAARALRSGIVLELETSPNREGCEAVTAQKEPLEANAVAACPLACSMQETSPNGEGQRAIVAMLSAAPPETRLHTATIEMLLDTGADAPVLCPRDVGATWELAAKTSSMRTAVDGIAGSTRAIGRATFWVGLPGGTAVYQIAMFGMGPGYGMPSVISHATVEDLPTTVRYAPEMTIYERAGGMSPITRRDDVYWVNVIVGASPEAVTAELARVHDVAHETVTVARARARVGDELHLLAARYCVSSQGVPALASAIDGVDIGKIPRASAVLIDTDEAYVRAWKNAPSSKGERPAKSIVVRLPGQVWVIDEWKSAVKSLYGECAVVFHVNMPPTGFGYAGKGRTATVQDWIAVGSELKLEEKLHEHEVLLILADAGVFRHQGARAELQVALKCVVRSAAGDDHDAVTAVEGEMDTVTRMTEAAMFRAKCAEEPAPNAAMIECRLYQRQILNQRPKSSEKLSRMHLHTRAPASVRTLPPYLFWSRMSVSALPTGRGPKGLMEGGRTRTGRLIGIKMDEGVRVMTLRACDTKEKITRKSGVPLDEHALLAAGVASGTAVTESAVQTDELEDYVRLQKLAPPPVASTAKASAPKPVVQYVVPEVELPRLHDQVDVLWKDPKGDKWEWWRGRIVEVASASGKALHSVEYARDPGKWYEHDLARDRYGGKHPWCLVQPAGTPAPSTTPQGETGARRPYTRARTAQMAVAVNGEIDDALEHAHPGQRREIFNALVTLTAGLAGDEYECGEHDELEACRLRLRRDMTDGVIRPSETMSVCVANVMAGKAGEKTSFKTASGDTVTYVVPRGGKTALAKVPDFLEWQQADQDAFFKSIMCLPGNEMIPEEELRAMGYVLVDMVTARRYKINEADGTLDKRKSRHSLDEARMRRAGSEDTRKKLDGNSTYTIPVGDLETKVFISEVKEKHSLVSIDWTDGYGVGDTSVWTPIACKIPDTIDVKDDRGRRMGVLLRSPLWGAGVAGFGFEIKRDEDCAKAGWMQCPSTPGMKYRGEDRAIVIIDDMLMRVEDVAVAARTHEVLSELAVGRGGKPLTIKYHPTAFGGLKIMRSLDRTVITLLMPEFVERAARKWVPSFVETGKLPAGVPSGKELRKALDEMYLVQGDGPLNKEQREVQSITGDLRWETRVLLRMIRPTHKLSCVAQRASPGSGAAARGVVAVGYTHRYEGLSYGAAEERGQCLSGFLKGTMDSPRGASIARIDGDERLKVGAPEGLDSAADATWSLGESGEDDVYTLAITNNGGTICAELKKVGLVLKASALTEGVATLQCSEKVEQAVNTKTDMGAAPEGPVILASDCEANLRVAAGAPAAQRLRHALRRWAMVTQRCQTKMIRLAHLPDAVNWVDFFTKWKDKAKVEASIAYLSNVAARLQHPAENDPMLDKVNIGKNADSVTVLVAHSAGGSQQLCALPWLD